MSQVSFRPTGELIARLALSLNWDELKLLASIIPPSTRYYISRLSRTALNGRLTKASLFVEKCVVPQVLYNVWGYVLLRFY